MYFNTKSYLKSYHNYITKYILKMYLIMWLRLLLTGQFWGILIKIKDWWIRKGGLFVRGLCWLSGRWLKKGNLSVHQSQKRLKNSSQTKIFLVWPSPTNLRFLLFNKLCSFFVTFISFRLLLEYRPLWVFANSVRFPNLPSFFFHLSRAIWIGEHVLWFALHIFFEQINRIFTSLSKKLIGCFWVLPFILRFP